MDTVSDVAVIVGLARDVVLLILLLAALLAIIVLLRKVTGLLNSVRRIMSDTQNLVSTLTNGVAKPAATGSGVAYGAGKVGAFLLGFRKRKRRKGEDNNGKQ